MDRARFRHLLPEERLEGKRATVVGAGAIGSWVTIQLVKMGIKTITVVDHDVVDETNVATQAYGWMDVGTPKVGALARLVERISEEVEFFGVSSRIEDAHVGMNDDITVLALDSLKVRETVVNLWVVGAGTLLVDPRMALEAWELNCFERKRVWTPQWTGYRMGLSERDAVQLPCGAAGTPYTGMFIGAVVSGQLRRWLAGRKIPFRMGGNMVRGTTLTPCWFEGEKWEADVLEGGGEGA